MSTDALLEQGPFFCDSDSVDDSVDCVQSVGKVYAAVLTAACEPGTGLSVSGVLSV